MGADRIREGFGDTVLWSARNDQLEFLQMIDLDPMLERT